MGCCSQQPTIAPSAVANYPARLWIQTGLCRRTESESDDLTQAERHIGRPVALPSCHHFFVLPVITLCYMFILVMTFDLDFTLDDDV